MAGLVDSHSSLRKGPWSHLGPKSFKINLLGLFFKGHLEGLQETILRLEKHRPQRRSCGAQFGSRGAQRGHHEAQFGNCEAQQPTEIAHFRRSLHMRPARFMEIARFCRSPASTPQSPIVHLRSLARRLRSPTATHQHEVGLNRPQNTEPKSMATPRRAHR